MVRLALVLSIALAACFRPVSRPPVIPLPDLPPDAFIQVRTSEERGTIDVQREVGTSCITGTSNCVTRYANGRAAVTITTTTMSMNGQELSRAQLEILGDPERETKLAKLDRMAKRCTSGRPWVLGGLGTAVGGFAIATPVGSAAFGTPGVIGGLSIGVAGILMTVVGAKKGAFSCGETANLRDKLDVSRWKDTVVVEGADEAGQMKALAERFNAQHMRGARR
jgi:hypothetical protein